jgi:prepilin-type N-terminal cleavage/methylation domain-containing protein
VRRRARGFTLLEMVVAVALVGLVFGSSLAMTMTGRQAFVSTTLTQSAEARARQALERIVNEIEVAEAEDLLIDPSGALGGTAIAFLPIVDVVAGVPVHGNELRIERLPAPGDPDDGADNDSDGLVDEGVIVLTRDIGGPSEMAVTLCTNVRELFAGEILNALDDNGNGVADEGGFNIQRVGSMVTIRICIEQPGPGGTSSIATVTTSITLRN